MNQSPERPTKRRRPVGGVLADTTTTPVPHAHPERSSSRHEVPSSGGLGYGRS